MGKTGKNSSTLTVVLAIVSVVIVLGVCAIAVVSSKDLLPGGKTGQVAAGKGIVDFGGRTLATTSDSKQRIEVSTTTVPPAAAESLNHFPLPGIAGMPFVVTLPGAQQPQEATLTRVFDEPLPEDTTGLFVHFDEETAQWEPVPATISTDRQTMEATVAAQGTWTDVIIGSGPGVDKVKQEIDATEKLTHAPITAGGPLENSAVVAPDFTRVSPDCSGKAPSWAKKIQPAPAGESLGLKTCAETDPEDNNNLIFRVANTSPVPVAIAFEEEPIDFRVENVSSPLNQEALDSFAAATDYLPEGTYADGNHSVWVLPGFQLEVSYDYSSLSRKGTSLYTVVPHHQEDLAVAYSYLAEYLKSVAGKLTRSVADFIESLQDPDTRQVVEEHYTVPVELFDALAPSAPDSPALLDIRRLLAVIINFFYRYYAFDHLAEEDLATSAALSNKSTELIVVGAFDREGNLASGVEDKGEDNSLTLFGCSGYDRRGTAVIFSCYPRFGGFHVCYHTPSMEDDQVACMWDYVHPYITRYRIEDDYELPDESFESSNTSAATFTPAAIELENGLVCEPNTAGTQDSESPLWFCKDRQGQFSDVGVYLGAGDMMDMGIDKSGPQWYVAVRKASRPGGIRSDDYERSASLPTERMKVVRAYATGWAE